MEDSVSLKILNKSPKIFVIENFLKKKYCDNLINISKNNLEHSMTGTLGNGKLSNVRTSANCFIPIVHDKLTSHIFKKICYLLKKNSNNFDKRYQVVKYESGQEYKKHIDPSVSIIKEKKYKHRRFTVLLYLNDVIEGGETYFPNIDIKIKPQQGKLIYFENYKFDSDQDDYVIDTKSYHCSLPVINCEKWVANLWYHSK